MEEPHIRIPRIKVTAFCQKWQITEMSLFGSVLRDDFRDDSDIDVLVVFASEARHTLFDVGKMREELEHIFGRNVDLVSRRGIERSENYLRRRAILNSARSIYVA